MNNPRSLRLGLRSRLTILATIVSVGVLSIGVLPSAAEHGGPHLTVIQRAEFIDDVSLQVKIKRLGRSTETVNTRDASDVLLATILVPDGALAPWHSHSGPGFLLNAGPGTLTTVVSTDCALRELGEGEAFVDPGQGTAHVAWNDSGEDVLLYAVFFSVTNGPVTPGSPPADCDVLP